MYQSKVITNNSMLSIKTLVQFSRLIHSTTMLNHNPGIKKKTKVAVDPKKAQRQKERQDAKMRKQVVQPPLDPDSIPDPVWFSEERQRPVKLLSENVKEERALLQKEWSKYQMSRHVEDLKMIRDKLKCRADALRELKKESEFLYNEALKVDKVIFPLTLKGPMETPPIPNYQPPDFVDEKK